MKNNVLNYLSLSMLLITPCAPCLASSQSVLDPYSDIQAPGASDENPKKSKKFKFPKLSHANKQKEADEKIKSTQIVKIIPTHKKQVLVAKQSEQKAQEPKLVRKSGMFKIVKNEPSLNRRNNSSSVLYETESKPIVNNLATAKAPSISNSPKLTEGLKQIRDGYVNTFKAATGGIFNGAKSVAQAKPVHEIPNKVCNGTKSAVNKVAEGLKTGGESIHKGVENAGSKLAESAKSVKDSTSGLLSKVAIHKPTTKLDSVNKNTLAQPSLVSAPVTNSMNPAIPIHTNIQSANNSQMAQSSSNLTPKQGIWQKLTAKLSNKKQTVQTASTTTSIVK